MKRVLEFFKKETVLSVAWILAIISAFFVHPSKEYIDYIDFRSLGILWGLMVIMQGLKVNGFFRDIGNRLLQKTKMTWQLIAVLIFLCFFFSMFITNDVALITFVPFAIYMLVECKRGDLLVPVIVLQTLAANLGSMLTPIGNPQNLYLYGISNMSIVDFVKLMFPYSAVTFVLLLIPVFVLKGSRERILLTNAEETKGFEISTKKLIGYAVLFVIALLVVAKVVPYYVMVLIVLAAVFVMDRHVLVSVDYALLLTFIGFFVFTGNLGKLPAINDFLTNIVSGREVISGVVASQVISNVPAALLLSTFTDNYNDLIIGVNLGGLGTLIASMASLISFKLLAHEYNELKGKYFVHFTIMNILFLAVLLAFSFVMKML